MIYFFYQVASVNSVQEATVVQFSIFCISRLSFPLVFSNLSKKLAICPQHLDVLMTSNRQFTTGPSVIELYTQLFQHLLI